MGGDVMGEYARAAIWAEQNGMEFADMSPEDWITFYDEDDEAEEASLARRARRTCPICGKRLRSRKGAEAHVAALHEPKAASRDGWRERIDAWKAEK